MTAGECQSARMFWLKSIQSELFSDELHALTHQQQISSLLSLNPFVDNDELLRVGGRLKNAPTSFNSKHPILLASHPLVTLIIRQAHSRALHADTQLTLATLRQDFWILRARSSVLKHTGHLYINAWCARVRMRLCLNSSWEICLICEYLRHLPVFYIADWTMRDPFKFDPPAATESSREKHISRYLCASRPARFI